MKGHRGLAELAVKPHRLDEKHQGWLFGGNQFKTKEDCRVILWGIKEVIESQPYLRQAEPQSLRRDIIDQTRNRGNERRSVQVLTQRQHALYGTDYSFSLPPFFH
ncbi:MAG: hypothetical protein C4519_25955 [Desulfobacteraceae bacterium]|nr:MAG: hypothetical protein C4519_25955 [Desulfobacteraceae bacterium]